MQLVKKISIFLFSFIFFIALFCSCYNLATEDELVVPKVLSIDPSDGTDISDKDAIVIIFNTKINIDSCTFGGTLLEKAYLSTWSKTAYIVDTLTLRPKSSWPNNSGLTLSVECKSNAGVDMKETSEYLFNTSDTSKPHIESISAEPGGEINNYSSITITFSEAINTGSLYLAGTMLESEPDINWSEDEKTLILSLNEEKFLVWPPNEQTLVINCEDKNLNSMGEIDLVFYVIDEVLPSVESLDPESQSTISSTQNILISFSENMDEPSLSLSGSLLSVDYSSSFDTYYKVLTISPDINWDIGVGQSLNIECSDFYGNTIETIELEYTVE